MEVDDSAYRHGLDDRDIHHALEHIIGEVTSRRRGDFTVWIGLDHDGRALEIGVLDFYGDEHIIHAMPLRRNWRRFISREES